MNRTSYGLTWYLCVQGVEVQGHLLRLISTRCGVPFGGGLKRRGFGVGSSAPCGVRRPVDTGGAAAEMPAQDSQVGHHRACIWLATASHHIRGVYQSWAAGTRFGNGKREFKVGVGGGESCAEALSCYIVREVAVQERQQHTAVCEAYRHVGHVHRVGASHHHDPREEVVATVPLPESIFLALVRAGLAKAPHHEAAPFDAELNDIPSLRLLRYLHFDLLAVRGGRLNSAARCGLQADNDLVEGCVHFDGWLCAGCVFFTTHDSASLQLRF